MFNIKNQFTRNIVLPGKNDEFRRRPAIEVANGGGEHTYQILIGRIEPALGKNC